MTQIINNVSKNFKNENKNYFIIAYFIYKHNVH